MSSFFILPNNPPIRPYYCDIENIYLSNGWGASYPPPTLEKMYANCYYILATTGSEAIGILRAFTDDITVTHLSEILVEKSQHGKSIGSALMQKLIDDLGHTAIYLEALDQPSKKLFPKFGFINKSRLMIYARKAGKPISV